MISKLLNLTSSICPFPHIIDNKPINGLICSQPNICKNCHELLCIEKNQENNTTLLCPKGFNYYRFLVVDKIFTINGIKVTGHHAKISRKEKKKNLLNIINQESIDNWVNKSNIMTKTLEDTVSSNVKSTLGMLHDVKTAVSIIFRNTESLIYEELGDTLDEKINNAPQNKKKLYKSVSLLEERLKMMNLVSNPDAATHGEKNPFPVYKVFDKILKIFHNIANKKHIRLKLLGTSFSSPNLYASFSTIPLVLIDNAIKYSQEHQDITVTVNDSYGAVSVQVESYSLQIDKNDSEKIFMKNFRANNADQVAPEGSGLGLYLADVVAYANGFDITHTESGSHCIIDDLSYVNNIFSFYIKG